MQPRSESFLLGPYSQTSHNGCLKKLIFLQCILKRTKVMGSTFMSCSCINLSFLNKAVSWTEENLCQIEIYNPVGQI